MALNLPPDPYKALGVTKDATLAEIRSAHRKLVLRCHPDKVQDPALKASKQDEFQKVQQAYELLSDETKRQQYHDQVKLFELRKEMGRGVPTARSNPFEYEVRNAEPRTTTTPGTASKSKPTPTYNPQPTPKYERPMPRSYEDLFEPPPRTTARPSKSQEYERKRPSAREEERARRERKEEEKRVREREEERERDRARYEKELRRAEKAKKREKEKERGKEKKRGSEEKHTRSRAAYVEDEDSDIPYVYAARPTSTDKKMKQRMEEDIRVRNDETAHPEQIHTAQSDRTKKMNDHKDFAAQYMQAARQKVKTVSDDDYDPRRPTLQRAETFAAPTSYNIRYATPSQPTPQYSDDDAPRRSSARSSSRRPPEVSKSTSRTRESKPSTRESRRSPPAHTRDPYIVEPPSPPLPAPKKPSLQSHTSAPPVIPSSRKEPTRSKTLEPQYNRKDLPVVPPSLPRASTFQTGDRDRGQTSYINSRLRPTRNIESDESDSDTPPMFTSHRSPSPPKYRHTASEPTRYIVEKGRTIPVRSHRSEPREDSYEPRDRSESPRDGRHSSEHTHPPLARSGGSGGSRPAPRSTPHVQYYTPPDPPTHEPIVIPVRPKMAAREPSFIRTAAKVPAATYQEVKYSPNYGPEHVVYTPPVPEQYRRGADHRGYDSYPSLRGERVGLYA